MKCIETMLIAWIYVILRIPDVYLQSTDWYAEVTAFRHG